MSQGWRGSGPTIWPGRCAGMSCLPGPGSERHSNHGQERERPHCWLCRTSGNASDPPARAACRADRPGSVHLGHPGHRQSPCTRTTCSTSGGVSKQWPTSLRHSTVSEISCVGSGGCSCSGHGSCEALAEEDGELRLGHTPLTGWHGPLFLRLVQDQEQQLQGCLVGRKMTPGSDRASEFGVQGLNGVGRVHQPAHFGGEGIERHNLAPGPSPARGNGRVFGAPGAALKGGSEQPLRLSRPRRGRSPSGPRPRLCGPCRPRTPSCVGEDGRCRSVPSPPGRQR